MPRTPACATVVLALTLLLPGCGGGNSGTTQSPSPVVTPPPRGLAAGAAVSVVSGADSGPVAGARVILAGREYSTDGAGQVVLADAVDYGSLVDVVAPGFLARQTSLRKGGSSRFVLWPQTTSSGVDEAFTTHIVYTWGSREPPEPGSTPLDRLLDGASEAFVWMSDEIQADGGASQRHEEAVAEINSWLGGRIRYSLAVSRPTGVLFFEARVDTEDTFCAEGIRAYFDGRRNSRGEITGGEIVYCWLEVARASTVIHELGHSVGLQHSNSTNELMGRYYSRHRREQFSEREGLVMNLLFERPAGNRFPDTDRGAAAAAAGPFRILCP